MSTVSITELLTQVDIFKRGNDGNWQTGLFVGRPFSFSYGKAEILTCDAWKYEAKGIPQGCFLLAYYDNEPNDKDTIEAVLLRVIRPTKLPTDPEVTSSMIEYYKDNIRTGINSRTQLDDHTRYEFSFSGLECTVLGSFYKDSESGRVLFGADLESFYSAHNYSVIKPSPDVLRTIVNYRKDGCPGGDGDIRIGKVRYSSSRKFQQDEVAVPVFVQAPDFAGRRTALFGMTRTGKSNTLKKIIQACVDMSDGATLQIDKDTETPEEILNNFIGDKPKYPIGQIIFDINGEYANANIQDQGTAIFELYKERTTRYSTIDKPGFSVMRVNFYREVDAGFELIRSFPAIADDSSRFVSNFRSVSLETPADYGADKSITKRYDRRVAVYLSCLHQASFPAPKNFKVRFDANEKVRALVNPSADPSKGLSLEEASNWWERFWEIYDKDETGYFKDYKDKKGKEWADDELKALLTILTRRSKSGGGQDCSGYRILRPIKAQHTEAEQKPFEQDILERLRLGEIIIVDLSLGDPAIQRMFSERITRHIFNSSMNRFTQGKPNNFIQFYFEEAHNLFPKKEDKDLSQIYNRLAKEGAKLNLGLVYATQEVSSISGNILKATQNWFISHLNNEDEIKELRKYYDFCDFAESLIRFSQDTDKGFVRMKTYSNPFVIPVQIDRFPPEQFEAGK